MPLTLPRSGFQQYESAYCCLNKVAWLNRMNGRTLRGLLVDAENATSKPDWSKEGVDLNTEVGLSTTALEKLLQIRPESSAERFTGFYDYFVTGGGDLTPRQYAPFLRYCPKCIETGFHTPLTQLRQVRACPAHSTLLIEACPVCGEALPYSLTTASISRPFACKNGHSVWRHIGEAIHLETRDPLCAEAIENYLMFRDELGGATSQHAWGLSLQARSENRLDSLRAPPSPAYWTHYTTAQPPTGMFPHVSKKYQRFQFLFDDTSGVQEEPPDSSREAKRKAAMAVLANVDPFAPLLQSVSASTARSILKRAGRNHRQCFHMTHEAAKDLMNRQKMPCRFAQAFIVWMRFLGLPSVWARTNERGCRELWPYRMDRNPPQFSILQNINLGLLRMHPFIEIQCKRAGLVRAARPAADWVARIWTRQVLLTAFVRCDELLRPGQDLRMDLEHLNLITPEMLIPYMHLSIEKATRHRLLLKVDVWEDKLEARLDLALAAPADHQANVGRVVDKWLRFARMGLIDVKQAPRNPSRH